MRRTAPRVAWQPARAVASCSGGGAERRSLLQTKHVRAISCFPACAPHRHMWAMRVRAALPGSGRDDRHCRNAVACHCLDQPRVCWRVLRWRGRSRRSTWHSRYGRLLPLDAGPPRTVDGMRHAFNVSLRRGCQFPGVVGIQGRARLVRAS